MSSVDTNLFSTRKAFVYLRVSFRTRKALIVTLGGQSTLEDTIPLIILIETWVLRFSSSLSLRMVYGFKAMEIDDPHILLAEEMMQKTEYAVIAGWAVDFLPQC